MLVMLTAVLCFNYIDRQAFGLVLQDIKVELLISDTQLGFLSGIAFAAFYALMGIPLARWADSGNRVLIIALTTGLLSIAMIALAFTGSFWLLMIVRVGVAVGEAGCIPPAHSLIAEYFDRKERPLALARYLMGPSFAVFIGYLAAGWLNQYYGWRYTYIILALPGFALALMAWFSLSEPRTKTDRNVTQSQMASGEPDMGLYAVLRFLWNIPTFRHLLLCFSIMAFFTYGIAQWKPAFFIRSFGMTTGELGTWLALAFAFGGLTGSFLGGEAASRWASNREGLQLKAIAIVYIVLGVVSASLFLSAMRWQALILLSASYVGMTLAQGPLFAVFQTLVPDRMRATSIALVYLFANLIGLGLGPLLVGMISDALSPRFGNEALRYALLLMCPGYMWAAWHAWAASRTVYRDILSNTSPETGAVSSPRSTSEQLRVTS
jgi:MFS family permease